MKEKALVVLIGLALSYYCSHRLSKTAKQHSSDEQIAVNGPEFASKTNHVAVPKALAKERQPEVEPPRLQTPSLLPPTRDPYQTDRFALRRMDLAQPKSIKELLSKLTNYHEPLLPVLLPSQEGEGDGQVLAEFRGYYQSPNGEHRRIRLIRAVNDGTEITLTIEDDQRFQEWKRTEKGGNLQLRNFNGDPYSLVLLLPDQRLIYLKFYDQFKISDQGRDSRAMGGWMLSKLDIEAKISPVLLVHYAPETASDWPDPGPILSSFPAPLLRQ